MSAKYKSPSFLLPNEINTNTNPLNTDGDPATGTGVNSLYSMKFDSAGNDYIEIGATNSFDFNTGDFSVSFWMNKTSGSGAYQSLIDISGHDISPYSDGTVLYSNTLNKIHIYNRGGGNWESTITTASGWNHICLVRNGANLDLYINNSSGQNSESLATNVSTTNFGGNRVSRIANASDFNGKIDEVSIFNRALNTTEIAALYEGTSPNIYPSNLIATNLNPLAYYPLGEQAQNTGYLTNEITNGWQFPNGVLQDYVMDFDGATVGDYIDAGDIPLEGIYTISFWINPDASPSSLYFLLDKGDGSSNISTRVTQSSNNTIRFQIGSSNFSSTDTLTNNSWNNVILIANGSSSKIYINNGTAATGTLTTAPNTTQSLLIGTDQGKQSTYYFNGQMSNVVVWNSDQSANIANIYNNGSPQTSYTVSPQNWWKLNATSVYTPSAPNYTTALDFNGTSDYISLNSINLGTTNTISLWYNGETNAYSTILGNDDAPNDYAIFVLNGTSVSYKVQDASNGVVEWNVTNVNDGNWHHFAFSRTNTTINLYIDGNLQTVNSNNLTNNNTKIDTIGAKTAVANPQYPFKGKLSNVAIYNSALTSSQVSTLFNFGTPETNISFDPQAWWKLDDQNAITDYSGNGNTGTNNGATNSPGGVAYVPSWKIPSALTIPTVNYTTALDFDGNNDLVDANSVVSSISSSTTGTVSGWIKYTTGGSGAYMITFTSNTNTLQQYLSFQGNSNGVAYAQLKNKWILQTNSAVFTSGNWHHYTVAQNGTEPKIYINGTEYSNGNGATLTTYVGTDGTEWWPNLSDFNTVTIGGMIWNSGGTVYTNYGDQDLSNISIYNSALTSSQISTLFNSGQPETSISFSPTNWWKLDAGGSTITDYGSGGNNGTNNGATQVTSNVYIGNIPVNGVSTTLPSTALQQSDLQFDSPYSNYSLNFDGTGNKIEASNFTQLNAANAFSVSVWVKAASGAQADNYAYIISTGPSDGSKLQIGISQNDTSNQLNFLIRNSSDTSYTTLAGVENFFNGNWRHIVCTYDGATMSFYTDGGTPLTTSHTGVLPIQSNMVLSIGASPTQNYFDGQIDETSIFNYALSSAQVLEIYNNGRPKDLSTFSGTAPISWWRLGENAYFDNNAITIPNSISGAPNGTGSGTINTMISADAPGTYANGIGTNLDIIDRVGDAALSTSNSQSYNMIPSDISPYVPQYVGDQIANNYSMAFDGVNDYVSAGSISALSNVSQYSISLWANIDTSASTTLRFFGNRESSGNYYGIGADINLSNSLYFYLNGGPNYPSVQVSSVSSYVTAGTWFHLVCTFNAGQGYVFINGVQRGSETGSSTADTTTAPLYIGQDPINNNSHFYGLIDEVAIFDTALNAGQIYNDIYQPTATAPGNNQTADLVSNPNLPNPVAWYRMGD